MNLLKVITLAALVLVSRTWLLADDPGIHVDDPAGTFAPVGLSFTFTSDAFGGGVTNFTNASGVAFTTLEIYVPTSIGVMCGGTAYVHCWQDFVTEGVPGSATIDFFGGPGIPNGMAFDVDLGLAGWPANTTFFAFANEPDDPATPEPGMLTLFASGLGAIWLRCRPRAK